MKLTTFKNYLLESATSYNFSVIAYTNQPLIYVAETEFGRGGFGVELIETVKNTSIASLYKEKYENAYEQAIVDGMAPGETGDYLTPLVVDQSTDDPQKFIFGFGVNEEIGYIFVLPDFFTHNLFEEEEVKHLFDQSFITHDIAKFEDIIDIPDIDDYTKNTLAIDHIF
jgi:hypothetical protein